MALLIIAAVGAFSWPMFSQPDGIASGEMYRDNDWLNCRTFDLLTRQSILTHGQFPLRSHLVGGGFPTVAHPSDGSWAPTLLAILLAGDVLGVKFNILLFMLLGCWGIHGLARQRLNLSGGSSLFAALLFGFSGWLPSMLLVGFYNQLFYLAAPGVALLLLTARGKPVRLLLAGFLLAMVLQQGGTAFTVVVFFMALVSWIAAAEEVPPPGRRWQRTGAPLLLLLLLLVAPALARAQHSLVPLVLGWGCAGIWIARSTLLRRFVQTLGPWALRLGVVLAVVSSLGAARLAGFYYLHTHGVKYQHTDMCKDEERDRSHECFYRSGEGFVRALVGRVPPHTEYRTSEGRRIEPTSYEYSWLGVTLPPLVLALLGFAITARRSILWPLLLATFTAICFGWELPIDAHRLLTTGIPGLNLVGQPIKYYNFFVLVPLVLLAGAGLDWIVRTARHRWAQRMVWLGAFSLLLWPFMQNSPALAERFRYPVQQPERSPYHQVLQIGSASWLSLPEQELRHKSELGIVGMAMLRETDRPPVATEYYNALRGVGTIDWYGTLLLPERAVPRDYLLMDGRPVANPSYRGEAWLLSGEGSIRSLTIRPNTLELEVELTAPGVVVLNQNYLSGFSSSVGTVVRVPAPWHGEQDRHGLLGVRIDKPGRHSVRITYGPPSVIAGLTVSAISLVGWLLALAWFTWRRYTRASSCTGRK